MEINILHICPDLLNLYGDKGNISALKMRLKWRGIDANVTEHLSTDGDISLENIDIVFLGGGSDREQEVVSDLLLKSKDDFKEYAENGGVILATCGGFPMLGKSYETASSVVSGLGVLDVVTVNAPKRVIGNVVIKNDMFEKEIVGFENHAGHTEIGDLTPLGNVVLGGGNIGDGLVEGVIYKNVIATYLHGPILPKNPELCDHILTLALKKKYPDFEALSPIDDSIEFNANKYVVERFTQK